MKLSMESTWGSQGEGCEREEGQEARKMRAKMEEEKGGGGRGGEE